MKIIKNIAFLLASVMILSACDDEVVDYTANGIDFQSADAFIQLLTPSIELVEGVSEYDIRFVMVPGVEDIETVNVYKQFFVTPTSEESNIVLAYTYTIDDNETSTNIEESIQIADLISGIVLPTTVLLPSVETFTPGTICKLTFEVLRSDGSAANTTDEATQSVTLTFLPNPYKGTYKVTYSDYWRIESHCVAGNPCAVPDLPIDWVGSERVIGALNDTAMTKAGFWGPDDFAWGGTQYFNLGINGDMLPGDTSYRITFPLIIDGAPAELFSGNRLMTCVSDPLAFDHNRIPGQCDVMVVPDAGGPGVHRLYLTYGYFTNGSGEREFYEVLEKID